LGLDGCEAEETCGESSSAVLEMAVGQLGIGLWQGGFEGKETITLVDHRVLSASTSGLMKSARM